MSLRNQNENIELLHELKTAASRYFNEERIETFLKQKFGKAIEKIEADLSKPSGLIKLGMKLVGSLEDEKDLFKLLADYKLIPKEITNSEEFSQMIEDEFNSQTKEFMNKQNLSELAISIDLLSLFYNNKIKNNLVSATKHYTDILYDSENYSNRLDLFDNLYEIGVLKGGKLKGYFECVKCSPNTFNGVITSDLKPSNLKIKCPGCGKEVLYIIPYELEKSIYNHIIHNDGILFFAIQYLFQEHQTKHLSNHKLLGDIEFDFCLLNEDGLVEEIIEVKMFKTDRPIDTQVGNIRSAVAQIKKSIDKMVKIESGYKHISKSIVTNINDDEVYKIANSQLKSDLDQYNIDIYTIDDFKARMELTS